MKIIYVFVWVDNTLKIDMPARHWQHVILYDKCHQKLKACNVNLAHVWQCETCVMCVLLCLLFDTGVLLLFIPMSHTIYLGQNWQKHIQSRFSYITNNNYET